MVVQAIDGAEGSMEKEPRKVEDGFIGNETTIIVPKSEDKDPGNEEDEEDQPLEELEMYRLDYESQPIAGGGEVLRPGDHVYLWCTLYQHHGIVLETHESRQNNENHIETRTMDDDDVYESSREYSKSTILIAEFTNAGLLEPNNNMLIHSSSNASNALSTSVNGGYRIVVETDPSKWHKVKYEANPLECLTWRPGTCSGVVPSPVSTILTRVQFLRDCRHLIPDYNVLCSNCETVAVWCMTGQWETLQGEGAMAATKMGAAALTASNMIIPGLGLAATGFLTVWSMKIGKQRQETAELLEKEFQWYAMGSFKELVFLQSG